MPLTILLVDDSSSVRAVLRVALEPEGNQVLEAADGREGVRLYPEQGRLSGPIAGDAQRPINPYVEVARAQADRCPQIRG